MSREINYIASETAREFHASDATVRCIMGPVGSGKSTSCCMEIIRRAMQQEPAEDGKRYSRWVVVRNTYPELQSTTIKDWTEWFPEESFGKVYQSSPIEQIIEFDDVHLTVWFISLDSEKDAKKFRGLRITGVWLNEASELPRIALDMALQRKGRYPDKIFGRPTWSGVIMDTNPPDEDHWIYKLFEEEKPNDFAIFKHRPAVIKQDGKYVINPEADYVKNLPDPNYYHTLINGQHENWIRVFVEGKYGTVTAGRLVYNEYNDTLHVKQDLQPVPGLPLMLSWDFGLTPCCLISQQMPTGQVRVLFEFQTERSGIHSFAENTVLPFIRQNLASYKFHPGQADPAGDAADPIYEELSCIGVLNQLATQHHAFKTECAVTNDFSARKHSVSHALSRLIDGAPGIVISDRCQILRRGLLGSYYYRRKLMVGEERYKDVPEKNMYSHLQDALQYACLKYYPQDLLNDHSTNDFVNGLLNNAPISAMSK